MKIRVVCVIYIRNSKISKFVLYFQYSQKILQYSAENINGVILYEMEIFIMRFFLS